MDARGNVTDFTYDLNGNLQSAQQPLVGGVRPTTSFTYTARGQVETVTDAEGMVTCNAYDPVTGDLLSAISSNDRCSRNFEARRSTFGKARAWPLDPSTNSPKFRATMVYVTIRPENQSELDLVQQYDAD